MISSSLKILAERTSLYFWVIFKTSAANAPNHMDVISQSQYHVWLQAMACYIKVKLNIHQQESKWQIKIKHKRSKPGVSIFAGEFTSSLTNTIPELTFCAYFSFLSTSGPDPRPRTSTDWSTVSLGSDLYLLSSNIPMTIPMMQRKFSVK